MGEAIQAVQPTKGKERTQSNTNILTLSSPVHWNYDMKNQKKNKRKENILKISNCRTWHSRIPLSCKQSFMF